MPDLHQLRHHARSIFDHALASANPAVAIREAVNLQGSVFELQETRIDLTNRRVFAIALGKAASQMASGLVDVLGDRITQGVLSGPALSNVQLDLSVWQTFAGGHPLPDENSLNAAQAAFRLLERADNEEALLIFLASGGGSAMLEWPASDNITLAEIRKTNEILVTCGASIREINAVRRGFSAVKGGRLAARAPRAEIITLIVSDTNQGDEASVASGPTLPAPGDITPLEVVQRYDLESKLPASVLNNLASAKHVSIKQSPYYILLDNSTALRAAAQHASSLGFHAVIADEISEQAIDVGCTQLLDRVESLPSPGCLISGGEFSCPVKGAGRGGRNLETVLRCSMKLSQRDDHVIVFSGGTDGLDGNSPAAGAIGDETTITRATQIGLDPFEYLNRSDSFGFFEKLGDAVITGPTGTNVRDVRILLKA